MTKVKGINDEISINYFPDRPERANLTAKQLSTDFKLIKEAGANAVRIHCSDSKQLIRATKVALDNSLYVWMSPRFINDNEKSTLKKLRIVAKDAEKLRKGFDEKLVFVVGNEFTLDTAGLLPQLPIKIHPWRADNCISFIFQIKSLLYNKQALGNVSIINEAEKYLHSIDVKLNSFLKQATSTVRDQFKGKVTYCAAMWENVDWRSFNFDYICSNEYISAKNQEICKNHLLELKKFGKPLIVSEFGCCTYEGAFEYGGGAAGMYFRIKKKLKYSQDEQVKAIKESFRIFREVGVDGCFCYVLVKPFLVKFDINSFGITKNYKNKLEPKKGFSELKKQFKNF